MTPISTDTPINAKKPNPDETEKWVCVSNRLKNPPSGDKCDDREDQRHPLPGIECRVKNEGHEHQGDWNNHRQTPVGPLLAFILSRPIQVVAFRQRHFPPHFFDGLSNGATEITSAHAVLDSDVSGISFAIDGGRAVFQLDLAELAEGNPLA